VTSVLRTLLLGIAFSLVALELVICLPGLVLLLPSRAARARYTCRCAHLFGRTFTTVTSITTQWIGRDLDSVQPAVFISNHASSLDFFVLMERVPIGTCSVGKRELMFIPFLGPFYALAGHLLIDRKNAERARLSLARAAEFIQQHHMSIWLAPEGTRSRDGSLGEFKRGFVHTAIATGLPVVPVVLHGCARLWPMGGWSVEPGQITVEVLAPIDTSTWKAETATAHAEQVRSRYVECLARPR